MILAFFIVYIIFLIFVEKKLIDRFNIKKRKGLYGHVNKIHKWGEGVIFIGYLAVVAFAKELIQYYIVIFFTVFFIFRALMEWKFEKQSRRYILSILTVIVMTLTWIILVLLSQIKWG